MEKKEYLIEIQRMIELLSEKEYNKELAMVKEMVSFRKSHSTPELQSLTDVFYFLCGILFSKGLSDYWIGREIKRLNTELNDSYIYGQKLQKSISGRLNWELAVLKAEQDLEDITHGINMGLKLEGYNMTHLSVELQNMIKIVIYVKKLKR